MTEDKTLENNMREFFVKNISLHEALLLLNAGWNTTEEHAMFLAAQDVIAKNAAFTRARLLKDYYYANFLTVAGHSDRLND